MAYVNFNIPYSCIYYFTAVLFVESMNKSTDPCEDFYRFACGNYGEQHRIPKTAISNDRFSEVHDVMLTFIRGTDETHVVILLLFISVGTIRINIWTDLSVLSFGYSFTLISTTGNIFPRRPVSVEFRS